MNPITDLFKQDNFVVDTIAQINKDLLGLSHQTIAANQIIECPPILDKLISTITPILKDLADKLPEQLSQFIYRVDLGENNYFDSLQKDPTLVDLAYQIIEREAQKVYLRKQFSS